MDPLLRVDLDSEWYLGATNINGTVGNGRLTVGVSLWGELTVLRWPSVSHFDQLRYLTAHGVPLRNYGVRQGEGASSPSYARWGRPVVLSPAMGSFGGLFFEGSTRASWFSGPEWEPSQRYEPADTNVLVTSARNPGMDITVKMTDSVDPAKDVLSRRFSIECGPGAADGDASFIYFANLAPSLTRARYYPVTSRWQERASDYLALYDSREDLVLHFRPGSVDSSEAPAVASRLVKRPALIGPFIDALDSEYPAGVFLALGGDRPSSGGLVGCDSFRARSGAQCDAFAAAQRGLIDGNPAAPRPTSSALSYELRLGPGATNEISVFLTVAATCAEALDLMRASRYAGSAGVEESAVRYWSGFSAGTRLPPIGDQESERVARRAILALAVGTDDATGALVASVARQPQYCFDWPRDGAFFDYALDLAGHHGQVTRHAEFYASVQIKGDRRRKRGHFRGHYYADGVPGPLPIIELDETGLAAWDLWRHARYLEPPEREGYLARIYPTIRMAADALLAMRPRGGGFPRHAHEDDNLFRRTRTLHGATATYLGLKSASSAGALANEDRSRLEAWEFWAEELRDAVIAHYDEKAGRFYDEGWRGGTWLIWPARILPFDDERVRRQAAHLMGKVEPFIEKASGGIAYAGEQLVACALASRGLENELARVKRALGVIAAEAVTPGTGHLGEVTLVGDFAGATERVFQNRTSIPHLWEGTLLYLAFTAAYSPEWFDFADGPFSW
jgi:hypothetical protein